MKLLRGSSLHGLGGIKPRSSGYIRPLLCIDKTTIINALQATGASWLIDPSNESPSFMRNMLRKSAIPALLASDARAKNSILKTATLLREEHVLLNELVEQKLAHIVVPDGLNGLCCRTFATESEPLQRRLLIAWLEKQHVSFEPSLGLIRELVRFCCTAENGSTKQLSARHTLSKRNNRVSLNLSDKESR
jgi:tRNA(Ile)-lysidine synthase